MESVNGKLLAGVRAGRWRDADVSVREERKRFYPWAIIFSALGTLIIWLIRAPFFVVRGGLVTLALFLVAAIANFRLKLSLHTLFAASGQGAASDDPQQACGCRYPGGDDCCGGRGDYHWGSRL